MPTTQSAILWPDKYLPGTTDNYVSNEIIVKDITASQIWAQLNDISKWSTYYHNVEQITPPESGPMLQKGDKFRFSTFGFPVLTCPVEESVPPNGIGQPGRLAWSAKLVNTEDAVVTSESKDEADVYHAWLVEDLPGGRVRVLTQESQIGGPCAEMGRARPNRMLLGHQDWLDGLIAAVRGEEVEKGKTNLGRVEGL